MSNGKLHIAAFGLMLFYCIGQTAAFGQTAEEASSLGMENRDPFIPLVDANDTLRKNFKKPSDEKITEKIKLMGISKIGDSFYALLDGELVKEGQKFNNFKIEKIDATKVVLLYGDRKFELKWETEEKIDEKK